MPKLHIRSPHVSPVCVPPTNTEFGGQRCLVTGWGKDGWGDKGKYQNVLKEVDVPVLRHFDCEQKLKRTRLGKSALGQRDVIKYSERWVSHSRSM